jgi:hypothetical protein
MILGSCGLDLASALDHTFAQGTFNAHLTRNRWRYTALWRVARSGCFPGEDGQPAIGVSRYQFVNRAAVGIGHDHPCNRGRGPGTIDLGDDDSGLLRLCCPTFNSLAQRNAWNACSQSLSGHLPYSGRDLDGSFARRARWPTTTPRYVPFRWARTRNLTERKTIL